MAGLKEIKVRLTSVRNTKKITYAMKLVSAAKLKKAQDAVVNARGYTTKLQKLISDLLAEMGGESISHPLLERRSVVKHITLLIVGGSRGLCGGFNTNVNKRIELLYKELNTKHPGVTVDALIVGKKPAEHFRRVKRNYSKSYEELPDDANLWPVDEVCAEVERAFTAGETDEVILVATRFRSALSMTVTAEKLLPLEGSVDAAQTETTAVAGVTLFEPSVKDVWAAILPRVMRSKVRQAFLDTKASEQGSRMTAMDSATKNAGDLIQSLQLTFNKVRQGRITAELLDIIGGAEAIN